MIIHISNKPVSEELRAHFSASSKNNNIIETDQLHCFSQSKYTHHDQQRGLLIYLENDRSSIEADYLEQIAEQYATNGEHFIDFLNNDFSIVVVDYKQQRAYGAIDKVGRAQLYFTKTANSITFASTPSEIHQANIVKKELNKQSIYNYVFFHMVPAPLSIFENIYKLSAAQIIQWVQAETSESHYWVPQFTSTAYSDGEINDYSDQLHHLLDDIINDTVEDPDNTGSFLSGGLDSSTLAGKFAEQFPGKAKTFSIGFNAEGYDEIAYARTASKHFGTEGHEYYVTPDDVKSFITGVVSSYEEPFGNSSAIPTYFCAKLAVENGISTLIGGDGGDEIFAGNERYVKQGIFQQYEKVPSVLRKLLIEPIFAHDYSMFPFNKIASYIHQANIPLPGRLQSYNLVERIGYEQIFSADFLANVDTNYPHDLQAEIYNRPKDASYIDRMLYLDWQNTLADNDLRKVTTMCHTAGVSIRYPLLDDRLLDFSIKLPDQLKLNKNNLRYFFKYAMKDYLPEKIINKQKHGFGLPFGIWLTEHKELQDIAYQALEKLEQYQIIHPDFISKLKSLHNDQHAGYYGEMVWILMILALWIEQQQL